VLNQSDVVCVESPRFESEFPLFFTSRAGGLAQAGGGLVGDEAAAGGLAVLGQPARGYSLGMPRERSGSAIGEALSWAARIMAVGLAMFLPAVAGGWLDARLGTAFLGPLGLVLGFVAGLAWLVRMATGGRR
jgi:hypothetical protein